MNQSGYNINYLVQEAKIRWLKPAEVLFILQNHENYQIMNEPPQKPPSGSFFLFNRRVLRFFRKDGHSWRRKKDGRSGGEAHERLKVGNVEALNCYYAHGEQNPNFQRRSYWMLDPVHDHIVMVHYRDISEVTQNVARNVLHSSPMSTNFSQNANSYSTQHLGSCMVIGESYGRYQDMSSPVSVEINSDVLIKSNGVDSSDTVERIEEVNSSSSLEMNQALRRLEEQLSINEDNSQNIGIFDSRNENTGDFDNNIWDLISDGEMQLNPSGLLFQHHSGDTIDHSQSLTHEANIWNEMLDGCEVNNLHSLDENGLPLVISSEENVGEHELYGLLDFLGKNAQDSSSISQEVEGFKYRACPPSVGTNGTCPDDYTNILHQGHTGNSLEDSFRLTVGQKQKFTIQEISPEWGYASEATKVIIVGSFLCDPSDSVWTCMFGDIEVPVHVVREGVMRCLAPPNLPPGKVTLCITSGNRESCSELREFEYRVKSMVCTHSNQPENDSRSSDELLLLIRFVQTLLSDSQMGKGEGAETGIDLFNKSRAGEDSWERVIEGILVGTWTSSITTDWLLQELLKDKLQQWLFRSPGKDINQSGCSLSKKEQGIIHMVSGLGFEWALHPLLKSGISVNFRDINGWSSLHWAARFGREKMVATLIASGASAGAVTDCNSMDLVGKTPASIATTYGHRGLAGYLSEVALTSHLSSLTLEESELSKGSADVVAERTISSVSETSPTTDADQLSLKDTLAAVRNASQAAARIQSAFRAHSFRKRREKEAAAAAVSATGDMYSNISDDIQGLSAASKLAFRNARDYNSAALSIQKKYRGWKGRKEFLAFRQKVVQIQAHVRGYQVRKQFHVCWAVGILEKIMLRWRRRGVGLRGFKHETESVDEFEDEDILKLFRKKKVDAALDEAVSRVLLMVECPEARQQYRRILEKYRQAKAELEVVDMEKEQSFNDGFSYMENDGNNQFT